MKPERHCFWQMEDQEVYPLGQPTGNLYQGRCCNPKTEKANNAPNGRWPCFWPANLKKHCEFWTELY